MPLDIPLPSASVNADPQQYIPLLLSAVEGFLQLREVWAEADYGQAFSYMEQLKVYIVECFGKCGDSMDVGMIQMWPLSSIPDGWLWCDGSAVSRATYADLFAVYSTTFGGGDGSTTFNLPNYKDRSPYGIGSEFSQPYETGGERVHTLTTGEIPAHDHRERVGNGANAFQLIGSGGSNPTVSNGVTTSTTAMVTGQTGGGGSHNNLHPVFPIRFVVRWKK